MRVNTRSSKFLFALAVSFGAYETNGIPFRADLGPKWCPELLPRCHIDSFTYRLCREGAASPMHGSSLLVRNSPFLWAVGLKIRHSIPPSIFIPSVTSEGSADLPEGPEFQPFVGRLTGLLLHSYERGHLSLDNGEAFRLFVVGLGRRQVHAWP